jgi:hypothetical protein
LYSVAAVGPLPSTAKYIEGLVETMSVMVKQQIYIFIIRKNCHDFVEIRTEVSYIRMQNSYEMLSHVMCF